MALAYFLLGTCGVIIVRGGYLSAFSPPTVQLGNPFKPLRFSGFFIVSALLVWLGGLVYMVTFIPRLYRARKGVKSWFQRCIWVEQTREGDKHPRIYPRAYVQPFFWLGSKSPVKVVRKKKPQPKKEEPKKTDKIVDVKKLTADQVQKLLAAAVDSRSIVREGNKFTITCHDQSVLVCDVGNASISEKATQIVVRRGARVNPAFVPEEPDYIRQSFSN